MDDWIVGELIYSAHGSKACRLFVGFLHLDGSVRVGLTDHCEL